MSDYSWVAPTVAALFSGIASLVAAIFAGVASRRAAEAKAEMAEVRKDVDGKMTKFGELIRKDALSEGKAGEKEAQAGRDAAVADALAKEEKRSDKTASNVAEVVAGMTTDVQIKSGPGVDTPLKVSDGDVKKPT